MKIKINKPLLNHKVGEIVDVEVNKHGVPLSIYWRRRFMDTQRDGCIDIIKDESILNESKSEKKRTKHQKTID